MSNNRELADLISQAGGTSEGVLAGRRNLIINGAMQVDQRGGASSFTSAVYTLDNWEARSTSGPTISVAQDSDAPDGFSKSLKVTVDTASASSSETKISKYFEGQNLQHLKYGISDAKQLTLSFWVKASQAATYAIWFYHPNSRHTGKTYTINTANTWEHKTVTISGDTGGTIGDTATREFQVEWVIYSNSGTYTGGTNPDGTWEDIVNINRYEGITATIGSSTSDTFQITGVQLEVGSVATPFEHRSYGEELALCKRYYEKGWRNAAVAGNNSGYFRGRSNYDVEKRATPSFSGLMVTINNQVTNRTTSNSVTYADKENFIFQHYPSVSAYSAGSNGWYYYIADAEL